MTNEVKQVFGSATTVISLAATLGNNAWTYAGLSGLTNTTLDNSTLLYPWGQAVLDVPDTFSAAPTAEAPINLWMSLLDIDGTSDQVPVPDSTALKQAVFVGAFVMKAYDVQQRPWINISLKGVQKADFFIENKCGVTLSYSTNPITVKIKPFTFAPAA